MGTCSQHCMNQNQIDSTKDDPPVILNENDANPNVFSFLCKKKLPFQI